MDQNSFLENFAAALPSHVAEHNAIANSPQGLAVGLSTVTDALGNAKDVFCKDFPPAYAAIKKYSFLLSWVLGASLPIVLAALSAVNAEVPAVCGTK